MVETVTVALVGDPKKWGDESVPEARPMRWEDRRKVDVELREDDTWATVIDRAAEELGVELHPEAHEPSMSVSEAVPYVSFYRAGARRPLDSSPVSTHVTLVDDEGRARWNVPLVEMRHLPYSDLLRADEAGALEGDPRRTYLYPTFAIGNGLLPDWQTWTQAIGVLWTVVKVAADAGGAWAFSKEALNLALAILGKTKEAEERHASKWSERGLTPHELDAWLGDRPWNVDDAAFHLDCSVDEAEAVLAARGFVADRMGLWRRSDDETADFLRRAEDEVEIAINLDYDNFAQILEDRVRRFVADGKRPTVPGGYSPDDLEANPEYIMPPPTDEWPNSDMGDGHDDEFDKELDERSRIPVETLMLRCGCQKEGCTVAATFGIANGQLKVGFTGLTNHFVASADYISDIAQQIGGDIYKAKHPRPE